MRGLNSSVRGCLSKLPCVYFHAQCVIVGRSVNVRPGSGGKRPVMRDTVWGGQKKKMVNDSAWCTKSMKAVLEERGVNTEWNEGRQHDDFVNDFVNEQTMVEKLRATSAST